MSILLDNCEDNIREQYIQNIRQKYTGGYTPPVGKAFRNGFIKATLQMRIKYKELRRSLFLIHVLKIGMNR